jgi:hypothetical protein
MRAWLKNIGISVLVFGLALGVWKLSGQGHDLSNFLTTAWTAFYTVGDAISNVFVKAWTTVFGG